jgi:hypothetical protein
MHVITACKRQLEAEAWQDRLQWRIARCQGYLTEVTVVFIHHYILKHHMYQHYRDNIMYVTAPLR